jgi:hypothetical protein
MNNISLALKISDFSFDNEYINNLLGLLPTDTHEKNQEFFIGPPHNRTKKVYESNYWEYRVYIKNNAVWIKTVIDQFAREVILSKKPAIEKMKNSCQMELYIGMHFNNEDGLDSFHFDANLLAILGELNIDIDIDQYLFTKSID